VHSLIDFYAGIHVFINDYCMHFITLCVFATLSTIVSALFWYSSTFLFRLSKNLFLGVWRSVYFGLVYLYQRGLVQDTPPIAPLSDAESLIYHEREVLLLRNKLINQVNSESKPMYDIRKHIPDEVVKEMAVAGSFPVKTGLRTTEGPGVLSIRDARGNVRGMASRIDFKGRSVMQTADHVYAAMCQEKDLYIEHKGKQLPFVLKDWKILLQSPAPFLDLVLLAEPTAFFSNLGVKSLKTKVLNPFKMVSLHGYSEGEVEITYGSVHQTDKAFIFNHKCSTKSGFSGTPIFQDGSVVGIHTGADVLKGENFGTSCFWLETNSKESDNEHANKNIFVRDFPEGTKTQKSYYRVGSKGYAIENYNRDIKVSFDTNMDNWYDDDLWDLDLRYESDFLGQVIATSPAQNIVAKEEGVGNSSAQQGSGLRNPKKNISGVPNRSSAKKKIRHSRSSGNVEDTKLKKEKSFRVVSDSKKLVNARTLRMEEELKAIRNRLEQLVPSERHLQSGIIPPAMQEQSIDLYCFSAQDLTLSRLAITRKQEKLYNKICHTRRYQQALKGRSLEDAQRLRKKTLEYVMCSSTVLKENPLQDFLSTL
jgi:hypothetical protein